MEQIINIDRMEHAAALFGSFDSNIKIIEDEFNVRVHARDSELKISGDAEGVLTEAADDPDIKNIVVNVARQLDEDGEAAYAEFRKSVQDILAREALIDGDMNAVMVVYVDDKGEIRGRDVRLTADGRQEITYQQLYVVKGSRFGTEIQLNVPDELVFHVNGSGTTHGDALKGTLNMQLTVGDKAMDLGTVEIDGTSKGGDFVGQMVFTPTQELLDQLMASAILPDAFRELLHDVKVIIVNQSTADRLDLKMTAFSGESELISLLFESSPTDPLELSIPADAVDMENWAGSINQFSFMTLMGNLQKAGIPMSFFTSLGGLS